ncbi:MAG: ABC transporter permease [Syntrophaceae bacterium]|nr:ABC transporter permease [Syntrophaceae bacterium]
MPKVLRPIISIAKYTLVDEVRQKSFIIMFVIFALFIFMVRGCYQGSYMVDGQEIKAGNIIILISKITFHIIAGGVMFLTGLLAMRIFKRDRYDGTQSCVLSKPITRWQYVAGKTLGLWILLVVFMFVLHGIVFLITSVKLNLIIPEYFFASVLCSLNLLFVIVTVFLLSLAMPDIVALLCVIGIGIVGSVADGIYAINHTAMVQKMMPPITQSDFTVWKVIYYLWPKLSGAQRFACSFIGARGFSDIAPLYPLINVFIYCIIIGALLFWFFGKKDIT